MISTITDIHRCCADCRYSNSLKVAREARLRSVAFPAISAGAFGYPYDEGAEVALQVCAAEGNGGSIKRVCFVLYEQEAWDAFDKAYTARVAAGQFVETGEMAEEGDGEVTAVAGVEEGGESVRSAAGAAEAAGASAVPTVDAGADEAADAITPAPPGWL